MQERTNAGQVRSRTGQKQDRSDAGQDHTLQDVGRTGQMQERFLTKDQKEAKQDECSTGRQIQDRTDAVQVRCRTGQMQERKYTSEDGRRGVADPFYNPFQNSLVKSSL